MTDYEAAWGRHQTRTWVWEIRLDGDGVTTRPVAWGEIEDTGLNALDQVVNRLPALIAQHRVDPQMLIIELSQVPF